MPSRSRRPSVWRSACSTPRCSRSWSAARRGSPRRTNFQREAGNFSAATQSMSGMPFQQNIENARAENIGEHGVTKTALDDALRRCEGALVALRKAHVDGTLPLLRLPARTNDLADIERAAKRLRAGASDV